MGTNLLARFLKTKENRSGQLFSADLMIAIILFILILVSIIWVGDFLNAKIKSREDSRVMGIMADYAISSLVETTGQPANWQNLSNTSFNESFVSSLGLAVSSTQPWVLDLSKADRLSQLNASKYDTLKRILGLRGADYEFLFTIQQKDRPAGIQIGLQPDTDAQNIIILTRQALMNNSYANLTLTMWQRCQVACG